MSEVLRVLLVEDSPTDAKLVQQELRGMMRPIEFERVETPAAMRAALERTAWDIVISDWSMPLFSAPAALAILGSQGLDVPFIIVSGTIGEDIAVDAMRSGAHDYVLKDKLGRLVPAIERELRESRERARRREAENALRESELRFRRLFESGLIGIIVAERSGRILEANDAFMDMLAYTRDDLTAGRLSWAGLTPPEWADTSTIANEQLRAQGVARPWEKEYLRKDGVRVPVLVGVAKLDEDRNLSLSIDIREQKNAEVARLRAEEALRQSEEQLRQGQKMEAVGRLAGGVAHDFNNMLSVILTYSELILDDLKTADPLWGEVEEIRKAAARAAGLTRQLLLFSRQQIIDPKVIDLHDVLTGTDKMLQRILGEDVELVLVPPKTPGRVLADPSHIEQVILNLVVNARDAMPKGGKLTIETANIVLDEHYASLHVPAKAGEYVMLAVSDTGVGMDRATQARIFEPFFTTKEQGKGTGLGLSTVFGIVQQSRGTVWVYSEPGKGTTFKVYLPRVDADVDVVLPAVASTTLRGTETILLVEDEEQVRSIIATVLRRQGYNVITGQNGLEALQVSGSVQGTIHLLLSDVVMPRMSGPELAKSLVPTRPQTRVLFMSGYTDDSIVRHGVLETGVAFIQKPVTPALLLRKIREVLDAEPVVASRVLKKDESR